MLAPRNIQWDKTAEVVVVGYGLAGAVAAITAQDQGTSALILEKQGADSHCSGSSISGGLFLSPSSAAGAAEYMVALCQAGEPAPSWTDLEAIKAWAEYTVQNKDWLKSLGAQVEFAARAAEHPQLPGADSIEAWRFPGRGLRLMQFMYQQVNSRKIEVLYQAPAQRLLTNEKGQVIGVKAVDLRRSKKELNIRASRAVILCSGGFEGNDEMKLQYLRVYPAYFSGGLENTGDGIKMAQEVGADLWHMNCVSARLVAKFPDFPLAFMTDFGGRGWTQRQYQGIKEKATNGFIIVDKYGRRYTSENFKLHGLYYELALFDTHRREYPRVPSFHIFDQRRMEYGPLAQLTSGPSGPHQLYQWSQDNTAELKKGWIVSGKTVAELASTIGVSPATLESTVQLWNRYCKEGKDPEFGRHPLEMVPLDSPPFYAIKLFPGGPNTQGGPRRNSKAQVVNPFGEPIPGLYSAGECGSVYGMLYPMGGGNLAECIAFGRIAGENAVREKAKAR